MGLSDHIIKIGIGVMILKDGKALMGRRLGAHGRGEYAWPGGHLEYLESIEECTRREVREETGMEIMNIRFLRLQNLKAYATKHYIDIGVLADWASGEPRVMEPDKIDGWSWYDLDHLPEPQFFTIPTYCEAYRCGRIFFDA